MLAICKKYESAFIIFILALIFMKSIREKIPFDIIPTWYDTTLDYIGITNISLFIIFIAVLVFSYKMYNITISTVLLFMFCLLGSIGQINAFGYIKGFEIIIFNVFLYYYIGKLLSSDIVTFKTLDKIFDSIIIVCFVDGIYNLFKSTQIISGNIDAYTRQSSSLFGPAATYGVQLLPVLVIVIYKLSNEKNKKKKLYYTLCGIIFIANIVFSGSRGSWIGIAFILILLIYKDERKKIFKNFIIIGIPSLLILLRKAISIYNKRTGDDGFLQTGSFTFRVQELKSFFQPDIIFQYYGFGKGIGQYNLLYNISNIPLTGDNTYIYIVNNVGIWAFIVMIIFFLYIIIKLIAISKKHDDLGKLSRYLIVICLIFIGPIAFTGPDIFYYIPIEGSIIDFIIILSSIKIIQIYNRDNNGRI